MAQLNDLLVMGQSTLLGPVKIDSIIDKNGSNGATNSSTSDKILKSDDNGKIYWGEPVNNYVLPMAEDNALGGVKTGYTGEHEGVRLDADGRMYVPISNIQALTQVEFNSITTYKPNTLYCIID